MVLLLPGEQEVRRRGLLADSLGPSTRDKKEEEEEGCLCLLYLFRLSMSRFKHCITKRPSSASCKK